MADLNVCRICLVHANNEKLTKIFENDGKIGTEIFLISGVQIVEISTYEVPALICESCLKDLKVAIKLRNRVRISDKSYFREISFDVEELNWNKKLVKLKGFDNDNYEEDPAMKCETVEEYLESDHEAEEVRIIASEETSPVEETFNEMQLIHENTECFQCEFCMQILSTKKSLDYHLKVKHNQNLSDEQLFVCEVCSKQFAFQKALNRHMFKSHLIEPALYECEECKKTFSSTRMLAIHMNKDHDAAGEFECRECHKIFNTRRKIKKHVSDVHNRKNKLRVENTTPESHGPCSVCGKFFKTRGQLSTHEKTHLTIKPDDYFFCDLCGNKFKAKSPLLTHIKLRHVAKIRFHCPDCPNRSWSTKYALQNHVKVFHQNIRDHRCEWCGKGFGAKDKLTAHLRIHTGEQPFQCQFCGKKYTHQTDFIRHKWSHTGERRYTCQSCKQGYIKKSQLDAHRCPWKQ